MQNTSAGILYFANYNKTIHKPAITVILLLHIVAGVLKTDGEGGTGHTSLPRMAAR